jgi:carbonic anhydrase/acetyltransferase-like protein (isoleucine patch superfamily)
MTYVNPFFGSIANAVKDCGSKLMKYTVAMNTIRHEYPIIRNQNIKMYRHFVPIVEDALFIAPNALVQGNVILGHNVAILYHSVVKNYHSLSPVRIGDNTVILERCTTMGQVRIGHDNLIGIGVTLDCCDVHDHCYIGHGASVQLGSILEDGCIIAPGTNIEQDVRVGAGEFWAGNPGRCIGHVTAEQAAECQHLVQDALEVAKKHKDAVTALYEESATLDREWLLKMVQKIEERNKSVIVTNKTNIPLEAQRFLQPRVNARRPALSIRVSYPVNRFAPWVPKEPAWTANV